MSDVARVVVVESDGAVDVIDLSGEPVEIIDVTVRPAVEIVEVATGIPGPPGAVGPPGPPGADSTVPGPPGPAGPAGDSIITATTPPHPDIGDDGDLYLDTTAGILYGPKSESATGPPVKAMSTKTPSDWYPAGYTFGQQITAVAAGTVNALRFFRSAGNVTATRTMKLWTAAGVELASVVTAETPGSGGWFEIALPAPVPVATNQTVVVSYDCPSGDFYAFSSTPFPSETPHLTLGVSHYGTPGSFPSNTRVGHEYADVVFIPPGDVWPVALHGDTAPVVVLTQAEYDALTVKDPGTVYVIRAAAEHRPA